MKLNQYNKNQCWWCGYIGKLTREHKFKKTDLELLYGVTYDTNNRISRIKYREYNKGILVQSPTDKPVKFEPNICRECNNSRSSNFDRAYSKIIEYAYENRNAIRDEGKIDLRKVYGNNWNRNYDDFLRYIGKHLGCRMAENGYEPDVKLKEFLNGDIRNRNLLVILQMKSRRMITDDGPLEFIYLGPLTPIYDLDGKIKAYFGWYTIANFTWNYIYEDDVSKTNESNIIQVLTRDYPLDLYNFEITTSSIESDFASLQERIEYYPFYGENGELNLYQYLKNNL